MSTATPLAGPATSAVGHGILLGRVGGIPVYLGRAWLVIAAGLVVIVGPNLARNMPSLGATAYLVAAGYAVVLLISVFLHEGAHAVTAGRCGVRVTRVVADLWGGHTAFEAAATTPGRSWLISAAGPLANAAVAGICWWMGPDVDALIPSLLLGATMLTNALLAAFNLLPGLPLDGGFLVEAVVWRVCGNRTTGTLVAGWCGRLIAVGVVAWELLPVLRGGTPNFVALVWMAMIGGFLWVGASHAIASARVGRRLGGVDPRSLATPAVHVPADTTAGQARDRLAAAAAGVVVLDDQAGCPVGLLDAAALEGADPHALAGAPATAFLLRQPLGWVLDVEPPPSAHTSPPDLEAVRALMGATRGSNIALRERTGRVVGVVHADQIAAHLNRPPRTSPSGPPATAAAAGPVPGAGAHPLPSPGETARRRPAS